MKLILCTLLLVAVLAMQTEAAMPCKFRVLEGKCDAKHIKFSFNQWANSCLISDDYRRESCTMQSVTYKKCTAKAMTYKYDYNTNMCTIR